MATSILAESPIAAFPTVEHICAAIQTAMDRRRHTEWYRRLHLLPDASSLHSTIGRSLVSLAGMNRMLISAASKESRCNSFVCIWPAALEHDLSGISAPIFESCVAVDPLKELHLLPILSEGRWTLFCVDKSAAVIEYFDFHSASIGCEMSVFIVGAVELFSV
jgi:hypothetical protein